MKSRLLLLTSALVLSVGAAAAQSAADTLAADTLPARAVAPDGPLLVDPALSPTAGAASLLAVAQGVHRLEDRVLPVRLGAERAAAAKAAGVGYRLIRLGLLDLPLEDLHLTARHELFGHGGRLRQTDARVLGYEVELPPPYGGGGGLARFSYDSAEVSAAERAAVAAGGLEVGTLGNVMLEDRWAATGRMDYRESLLYLLTTLSNLSYIADAQPGSGRQGHDVDAYLQIVDAGAGRLEANDLRRASRIELANPQLYFALYTVFGRYLAGGSRTGAAPRLTVGGVRLLPRAHLWLAPFGPEYEVGVAAARGDGRLLSLSARVGAEPQARSWGAAARGTGLLRRGNLAFGARLDVWHQPAVGTGAENGDGGLGGLVAATARLGLRRLPAALLVELGGKTEGYTPGEALGAGPVLRAGISWTGR